MNFSRGINTMIGELEHIKSKNVETIKDSYKLRFFYLRLLYFFFFCCYQSIVIFYWSFIGTFILCGIIVQVILPLAFLISLLSLCDYSLFLCVAYLCSIYTYVIKFYEFLPLVMCLVMHLGSSKFIVLMILYIWF